MAFRMIKKLGDYRLMAETTLPERDGKYVIEADFFGRWRAVDNSPPMPDKRQALNALQRLVNHAA